MENPPLHLRDTGFAQKPVTFQSAEGETITDPAHIASPDVHVLQPSRQFVMLYHGLHEDGTQATRIAVSRDGMTFSARGYDTDVAPPYLRLCRVGDRFVGVSWGGELFSSRSPLGPFEQGPPLLEQPNGQGLIPRHPVIAWVRDKLHCLYSLIGDCPERIWQVTLSPSADWADWEVSAPAMVLAPECRWEGADLPQTASQIGAATEMEHALRDPFVFEDYLFYVGGGEQCIAVARFQPDNL